MGGSVKGNFVVSDELTVTVSGLGLQPGSGHSCAVELSAAGCTVVHHPRQFGPVTKTHHPRVHRQRQFGQMTERRRPQSPYRVTAGPCLGDGVHSGRTCALASLRLSKPKETINA